MKIRLSCLLVIALAVSGCASRSKATAEARNAFAAGQQQAVAQMLEAQRSSIQVLGQVRNPEIPWADGLTLSQAIVAADYRDRRDPREIVLIRQGERIPIDPKILLRGDDVPLQAGDTVEIRP